MRRCVPPRDISVSCASRLQNHGERLLFCRGSFLTFCFRLAPRLIPQPIRRQRRNRRPASSPQFHQTRRRLIPQFLLRPPHPFRRRLLHPREPASSQLRPPFPRVAPVPASDGGHRQQRPPRLRHALPPARRSCLPLLHSSCPLP